MSHVFWTDERCVPPDHPNSNYGMARETLLARLPAPPAGIHRMRGEIDPDHAASEYEATMRRLCCAPLARWPKLDLVILGIGEDGHTASIFPGSEETDGDRWVVAPFVEKLGARRLSMTLGVINHAEAVVVLASGASKAHVVRSLLHPRTPPRWPAEKIRPLNGRLTLFVDEEACAGIEDESRERDTPEEG